MIINVIFDMWTDAHANVPYINVSTQFFDKNFKFHVYHLSTEKFLHPHTGLRIAKTIETILESFGLGNRKFKLIGDGGANLKNLRIICSTA